MKCFVKNTCPACGSSDYEIIRYDLVEDELGIKCKCACGASWRNWYSLVFNGFSIKDKNYDSNGQEV